MVHRIWLLLALALLAAPSVGVAGCAGCENTVCCALDGHALPRVLRPSQCTAMGGASVPPAMCDVVCCEAPDGTRSAGSRATCTHVVDTFLCDTGDGG